jgi:integrase/recombinase XerC
LPAAPILGDALLQSFARSLRDQDLSPVTVRDYLHDLKHFRIWIEESRRRDLSLGRLTTVQLVNYRQHLLRVERLKATTINRKIQALKKLFGWARQKGHVKLDVSSEVQFVRVEKRLRPRGLTEAEIQALLRAAGQTGQWTGEAQLRAPRGAARNRTAGGGSGRAADRRPDHAHPIRGGACAGGQRAEAA